MYQEVAEKRLQIEWISTDKMTSDGFTKALTAQKHQAFIRQLGLVDIRHLIEESSLNWGGVLRYPEASPVSVLSNQLSCWYLRSEY